MAMSEMERESVAAAFAGRAGAGWLRADCPLCLGRTGKEDRRQSMGLNAATGGFVCHKCGVTGWLKGWESAQPVEDAPSPRSESVELCEGFVSLGAEPGASADSTRQAREYLAGRGVSREAVVGVGVGAALWGWRAGRVVVPHRLSGGPAENPWSGWVGRDYTGRAPMKYLYSRGLRRDRLWNEAALFVETGEPIALVEGVFDALPHWPRAAAFLGKPTAAHVEMLSRHRGRPLAIALDGDSWEEGWALAEKLRFLGAPAWFVRLPPGEDPCSVGKPWFDEAVRSCLENSGESSGKGWGFAQASG